MKDDLLKIASGFRISGTVTSVERLGEGFINDTFLVKTRDKDPYNYLLQKKNRVVFPVIPAMMENMLKVTGHLKRKIIDRGGDPLLESLTVIPYQDGMGFFQDTQGEFWAMCLFIEEGVSHEKVSTPEIAFEGGKGIGLFHSMLSDLKEPLADVLPGFHNIRYRFKQWDETLLEDRSGRKSRLKKEIEWVEERRDEMFDFWKLCEAGTIPARVSHNDTKINNILFNRQGKAFCMIDLDTVMNSTVLNDFGDAIRTYANTGSEDDLDLDGVSMNITIFEWFTRGYLSETASLLSKTELEYLAFGARYITYEQMLRFLMDYIDGDRYYKIKSPLHNLQRTHAQYKLLRSMEEQYGEMQGIVRNLSSEQKA